MTKNNIATVETLTAEVRVLMVGSRQVTMSVYNQLDYVDARLIEPFGRVNPKDAIFGYIDVVGRHRDTGVLVSSRTAVDQDKIQGSAIRMRASELNCLPSQIPDDKLREEIERLAEIGRAWSALPLIVLAGLR